MKVFISYSHKDKRAREKLDTHLAPLVREGIEPWFDGEIGAGGELNSEIRRALREAEIFVALASPDYLKSNYCFVTEYGYALRRAARKSMYVVVAVIRPCQWKHTRMGRYKALPNDGKPTTHWSNRDLAYEDIVDGLRRVVALARAASPKRAALRKTEAAPSARPATKKTASKGPRANKVQAPTIRGANVLVKRTPSQGKKARVAKPPTAKRRH